MIQPNDDGDAASCSFDDKALTPVQQKQLEQALHRNLPEYVGMVGNRESEKSTDEKAAKEFEYCIAFYRIACIHEYFLIFFCNLFVAQLAPIIMCACSPTAAFLGPSFHPAFPLA